MKNVLSKLLIALCLSTMCMTAYACDEVDTGSASQAVMASNEITPYQDVIVLRTRLYNGVPQYRHWNKTRACWVEPDWITMT